MCLLPPMWDPLWSPDSSLSALPARDVSTTPEDHSWTLSTSEFTSWFSLQVEADSVYDCFSFPTNLRAFAFPLTLLWLHFGTSELSAPPLVFVTFLMAVFWQTQLKWARACLRSWFRWAQSFVVGKVWSWELLGPHCQAWSRERKGPVLSA